MGVEIIPANTPPPPPDFGVATTSASRRSMHHQRSLTESKSAAQKVGYHTVHRVARRSAQRWLTKVSLIRTPLWFLVIVFVVVNALCVVAFAALYLAAGRECYVLASNFSFAQMLWLSVHVFTTVGFGTLSPGDCVAPQLIVFVEHFVALIDIALFTAIILSKLMQPSPSVRFSRNFLISDEADGRWLTFRMARESPYQLRDCELSVQCGIVSREGGVVTGCTEQPLPLQCAFKSNLETWFVRHRIDDASPLREGERLHDLAYMNVTLKLFDSAFMQEVRLYHNYTPSTDAVHNARFEVMKFYQVDEDSHRSHAGHGSLTRPAINTLRHTVDHSLLDAYRLLPV